jgi:hypothetical protein
MNRLYVIAVLFAALVVILICLRVYREKDSTLSLYLKGAFLRFMIFFVGGMAILILLIWFANRYEVF